MIPLSWFLTLGAALFCVGVYGALARRNSVAILMGIELMLNAVNITLVAFWHFSPIATQSESAGLAFVLIVFSVAASEAAVGLALMISMYRRRNTIVADDANLMKF